MSGGSPTPRGRGTRSPASWLPRDTPTDETAGLAAFVSLGGRCEAGRSADQNHPTQNGSRSSRSPTTIAPQTDRQPTCRLLFLPTGDEGFAPEGVETSVPTMSSQNASTDSSTDSNQPTLDCGHTDDTAYGREFLVCEDCHLDRDSIWFGLEDYPEILAKRTVTVHARNASQSTSMTVLLAIDEQRRAVYYNNISDELWYVAPEHSRFHDTDDPIRSPLRDRDVDATLGAPSFPEDSYDFHTLPNGDHLALVEREEAPRSIRTWVGQNVDSLREIVEDYQPTTHPAHGDTRVYNPGDD